MKYQRIRDLCARGNTPPTKNPRTSLNKAQRAEVLAKTSGRCHVCGSRLTKKWRVDHVIPHRLEGPAVASNYLPICRACNGLRWGYRPKVLRLILLLGIEAKQQIRHDTEVGQKIARLVYRRLRGNKKRRLR
jgi:5-methylcytosine-specific restriction endonuclease McrA